ncbi:M-phase phosphoprotein 8 [Tupaia chinensis]|uniref:Poly [ADP-ribose] polymerase n=1 Tax=Tupaia chinensis TaxID=246437 RepID=L9KXV8_TUPCH|nr:M-phase phosphoprotein 8 [Tupaia chinensis]
MTVGIFANCTFCLKVKCLPRQQKKKLQSDIEGNGGKFSFLLTPQCTHMILDNADVLSQHQLNSIRKNHIHIANPDFIWDSIKEKRLLDINNYDLNKSLDIMPPPDQKTSSSEVKTDSPSPDSDAEKENIMELSKFYTENVEIPPFPQDFEVAKYNSLEKAGAEGGQEVAVVELRCSQAPAECPFLIFAHFLLADGVQTRRQFTVKKTSADASEYYENYIEALKKQGFLLREHFTPEATQLASEKLQAVTKAEGILLLVKAALKNGETAAQLQKLMTEFYRLIPHKGSTTEEVNLRLLAKKEDLCQLIRDMVNVCETNLSKPNPPSLAKYRALRCKIEHVEQNTEEFFRVRKEILQNNRSKSPVDILQIFRVGRVNETTEFLSKLGNVRRLLHGSPVQNIVGILSRGLLLPKRVEDRGVQRTDAGNLGSGIYFSDSLSTSVKYSHPGETDGTRLVVVCDVALGKCLDLYKKDFSLTEAPPGYDSVHGVSEAASVATDFEDDEFVVYKTNQVKMKYIIKFCMPGDQIKDFHPLDNTELEEYRPEFSDFSKVEDYQLPDTKPSSNIKAGLQDTSGNLVPLEDVHIKGRIIDFVAQPCVLCVEGVGGKTHTVLAGDKCPREKPKHEGMELHIHSHRVCMNHLKVCSRCNSSWDVNAMYTKPSSNIKAGLQDTSGNLVPLEDVHIKGRIIDFVAQVIVFQTYTNQSHVPIEAKYIFPLDDKAAVCGFEAFINGKHIVGEIKEKEEAQREYREAISQGHGAYLMDQDAPDVFTVSVGNLPPKAKVLIKITYITELSIQGSVAVFFMPATVAPWQQNKALNENLQSTDCRAVISTVEGSSLDSSGFSLHISLSDAYLPRMWVEKHPEKESEACMLVFQPDLDLALPELANSSEVIICLDCSNSMEGVTFMQAKKIALYALSLVGEKQRVNLVQFGTGYKELFSYPKYITNNDTPTEFIMSATPSMGNTDFWKTLRYLGLLYPSEGLRNILLVSDGHLQDESLTLQLVKKNAHHTRLFTCGVGSTANRHVLRTLSQCGAGVFEYFNSKSTHSWKKQIEDQMTRVRSPSCHSVSVKWQQFSANAQEPLQAPAQVQSLFHNDRLLVYGFIPHCTQATLRALIQEKEFCTMVSTTELQKTTGTMIHKLTARALIRDYEDGILHENATNHEMKKEILKSLIIKLSKENSLITQFTSFIAVEKRDDNESFRDIPNISDLIAQEDVDFLPYISWPEEQPDPGVSQQPLLASPEWNEGLGLFKRKGMAKRKTKSSKPAVPVCAEWHSLPSQPALRQAGMDGPITKKMVREHGGKDMRPIKRLLSAAKFRRLNIFQDLSNFRFLGLYEDDPVDCSLVDILEPNSPVLEMVVMGQFPITEIKILKAGINVNTAILVLSDTQLNLLTQSMKKRILLYQQELVRSILEPNFKYPWCLPFILKPELLNPLQGVKGKERLLDLIATLLVLQFLRTQLEHEGIFFKSLMRMDVAPISRVRGWVITYGLLEECGLKMEMNNPKSTWDLEAKGKILYKVRWKGYTSDDDTWEPEVHLEDCKEVLLEFRKKVAETKAKAVKKDIQRLSLSNDIFEANSDSEPQSETKEDTSPRKKKKKLSQREEKSPDLKKKKVKTGKLKDKSKPDLEGPSENFGFDLRTKKRIFEVKEELKESKKPKKDEIKETKELKKVNKKGEMRDLKTKIRDDPKENRKTKKEKCVESQLESESSVFHDSPFQEDDNEDLPSDNTEEKQKVKYDKDRTGQDAAQDNGFDKQLEGSLSADEDTDIKVRRKKKKPRKTEEPKKVENKNTLLEKRAMAKKQRNQDRSKTTTELDKPALSSSQIQKGSRSGWEERSLRSSDSAEEDKESKKYEPKEKYQKRHDSDKEEKGWKEPKGFKTFKEIRNAFDLFKLTPPEEKNDVPDNNRRREEITLDSKTVEDHKTKENKQASRERRNTRDETDTWAYIAAEGDQEALDSMCQTDENSDGRQQILNLGMDLQLEWMKLEDFQKHLDGEDEDFAAADAIPSNLLRDAVKNGDYITVKVALNSDEEYNLDQEDSSGMTLVMLAAAGGQDDLLRLLITKGAKVNGRQKNGTTALIHAAEKNFLTTVAILLEAGAFVNVQQSNGETALMKACKRGNSDIVRLVIECGADCNILSKHQNSALHFAKQYNNVLVYDLLKSHLETLSRVAEETIKDYFEARLTLLEPVFPIACHRLCEGPDFSTDFNYKPPQNIPEGSGILLFIFHANFLGKEVIARLCGPCSVQAVVLNDKFQLPVFLDSHFVYSFSPVAGANKLFIRLTEAPSAKVKLLIGAYRVQLQ